MKTVDGVNFEMKFDDGGSTFVDAIYKSCIFDNCGLSLCKRPERMSKVRRISVQGCYSVNSSVGPCEFEDVFIHDLKTNPILLIWSSFFRRVTLSGKIGKMNINAEPWGFCTDIDVLSRFSNARAEFYGATDWAIDISQARFLDFNCRGVPFDLIRRDPETQVILCKDEFPGLDAMGEGFNERFPEVYSYLKSFSKSGDEEVLLVVPLAAPKSRKDDWRGGIAELRALGFVKD